MSFARCVLLGFIAVCAACGGRPGVNGKAFLLGQTDHSGTRVLVLRAADVIASAFTDGDGTYRVEAPGGAYDLHFEHDGYQTAVQPDVVIGKNDVSVPETTLRRGAFVGSQPVVSAQALGSTKALVQFGDGIDSPSYILDLASGKTKQVAAGGVTVLDANDQFATVRVGGLHRLDLSTAALAPVDPPEGDPQRGFAAGGYYVYPGLDGKLNAVATGTLAAVSFDVSTCARFASSGGSARDDTPGWITVPWIQACDASVQLQTLVNPSLRMMSGAFSALFVRSRNAFLLEPTSPARFDSIGTFRSLDLVTGIEGTLEEGVVSTRTTGNPDSLLLTLRSATPGRASYAFVDLQTATARDAAVDAAFVTSFPDGSGSPAFLVASGAGSTIIRLDTGNATPLCNGVVFSVLAAGRQPPLAIVCSSGGTIRAYEWDTDSVRTLSTSATSSALLFGRVVTWNEGASTHGARVGSGDPPVLLCPTTALVPASTSAGGESAALFCPDGADPRWIAVDLRTGASQTILARGPGSVAAVNSTAVSLSAGGRGVLLAYVTDAPAGDPLNCGAQSCTLVLDLRNKAAAVRPSPQAFVLASASPDDHGFLVNPAVDGRSLVAVLGDGAPTFASVPFTQTVFGIGRSGRAALLLSSASFPVFPIVADLASGTTTAVSFLDNSSAPPLDADGDFVIREGIAHLDTGTIEAFPAGWAPLCNRVREPLLFFDPSGTTLQEYGAASGVRTVAHGIRSVQGSCFESFQLFLATGDGVRGTLLRYARDTGTLTEVAQDVSAKMSGALADRFVFQHPDLISGDLLLLPPDGASVRPLRARAHLLSQFLEGGKRVAFTGGAADGEPKLMVANLDGSGARTVGPAADRVIFAPDGAHLVFEARGLLWAEAPTGPAVALDERDRTGKVVVSGSGQYLLYSVLTGERRGTYRVDLGPSCTGSVASCTAPAAVF